MKIKKSNIILILILVAVAGLMTHVTIRYNNAVEKEAEYKKEKALRQKVYEIWEHEHSRTDSLPIDSVESKLPSNRETER